MKVLKWLGYTVLVLIIITIPVYWWLAIESHAADRKVDDFMTVPRSSPG